jgi:hypothetical protein
MKKRREADEKASDDLVSSEVDYEQAERELYEEHGLERYPDPEQAELTRRESEALQDFRDNPRARSAFARQVGATEHGDWQHDIRRQEAAAGRREARDYGIEYVVKHPDGGNVRYDYVDLKGHQIVDRKPIHKGETVGDVSNRYAEQRGRHVEAYEARFQARPEYSYSFYPSTKDMDDPVD